MAVRPERSSFVLRLRRFSYAQHERAQSKGERPVFFALLLRSLLTVHGSLFTAFMRSLWLIALAVSIAGCGYKGPLYLPKPKPEAQKPVPAPAAQPAEERSGDAPKKE